MNQSKDSNWQSEFLKRSNVCCLKETYFRFNDICILKVKKWKSYIKDKIMQTDESN